jgi:hypothetical protein
MRNSYIRLAASGTTSLIFGSPSADLSGAVTKVTQYCGLEDISLTGAYVPASGANACGLQFTEAVNHWCRNVIVEAFPNNSIGVYLLGSTTTSGATTQAPPVTHCQFDNMLVTNMQRPLVVQNAEECMFNNCQFILPSGLSVTADSLFAIELRQGHNNRFYSTLVQGDRTSLKTGYVGVYVRSPVNEDGVSSGDNTAHQFYGLVAEGFDRCYWVGNGSTTGQMVLNPNWSIYSTGFQDDAAQNGYGTLRVMAPYHKTDYTDCVGPTAVPVVLSNGSTQPNVLGSNNWATASTSTTTIIGFVGTVGQSIFVRLDAKTNVLSGTSIKCPNGTTIVGALRKVARFTNLGGVWYTESISQD